MPPTKYMPGDIFQGHIIDGMFNFTGIFTGQDIMLLGMLTEALHTPLLQDRYLSIKNAKYVFEGCRHLADEVEFKPGGMIEQRANDVAAAGPSSSSSTCARSACSRRSRTASSPTSSATRAAGAASRASSRSPPTTSTRSSRRCARAA